MIPPDLRREFRPSLVSRLHPLEPIAPPKMSRAEFWSRVGVVVVVPVLIYVVLVWG